MQQHSFIPLRHKDPLHKHIHNFAFPDGFFIQASPGAEDGVSYTDFQFQAASTESNSLYNTLCCRTLIFLLLIFLRHLHKFRPHNGLFTSRNFLEVIEHLIVIDPRSLSPP